MSRITIRQEGSAIVLPDAAPCTLAEAIALAGFSLPMPCAGNHTCGKCRVYAYGAVTPPDAEERRLLPPEALTQNIRLACYAQAVGDCTIELFDSDVGAILLQGSGAGVFSGSRSFAGGGWALAADIGTTTVAAYLLAVSRMESAHPPCIPDGLVVDALGAPNAQAAFGADVISRMEQAAARGVRPLQDAILTQLNGLFEELLERHRVPPQGIAGVVLTGNTVMLHLAAGLDPAGLCAMPFTPQSLFGVQFAARKLFSALSPATSVYFAPCADAFVGGDLISAAVACALAPGELLLDIGTNGEMALATEQGLLCCATAAGPAFEGGNLHSGMTAAPGAICAVQLLPDGGLRAQTIGNLPPKGICGAGVISALAALRMCGGLDETGRLAQAYDGSVPLGGGVTLTQQDIRQLQLAKAAIAAGIDVLLDRAGLLPEQITRVYLAGGFGTAVDPDAAAAIGLFPPVLTDRIVSAGNAAGIGAIACACWQAAVDTAERLAQTAEVIPLATDLLFNERYIEQMGFQ